MKLFIYLTLKRIMDIIISLVGLIILSPLIIVIVFVQYFLYGKKIFFNQKRVGMKGKIFKVFKFKTMNEKKDDRGILLPDKFRVTAFGKFLRSYSLDEIPQIFNILFGQMSVVGPRPQSIEVCLFMSKEQFSRHKVKPGLTGLSAINGRNGISWKRKIDFDLEYLKRRNLFLDIKIILITAFKVVAKENVFSEGNTSSISLGEELLQENKISLELFEARHKKIQSIVNNDYFYERDLVKINEN